MNRGKFLCSTQKTSSTFRFRQICGAALWHIKALFWYLSSWTLFLCEGWKLNYEKVSEKVWRLEFHEATDAFRGFFFQVAFQVPTYASFSRYYSCRVLTTCRVLSLRQKCKLSRLSDHSNHVTEKSARVVLYKVLFFNASELNCPKQLSVCFRYILYTL